VGPVGRNILLIRKRRGPAGGSSPGPMLARCPICRISRPGTSHNIATVFRFHQSPGPEDTYYRENILQSRRAGRYAGVAEYSPKQP
jgi:hypothetical protein